MVIEIKDDFDLQKIADSGQCFRIKTFDDGAYRFVTGSHILYIRQCGQGCYDVNCSEEEWRKIWFPYFDLPQNYSRLRSLVPASDAYMLNAAKTGSGLRILRQEPWEMVITFIISQRKNIPSIKKSVELLSAGFGEPVVTPYEKLYLFPSAKKLVSASDEALSECRLGYRTSYIQDAAQKIASNQINLSALKQADDTELFDALKQIRGVGDKVANCICLFAYGRTSHVPVDTWIHKVIDHEYHGKEPFTRYGKYAGIMQQYIFYYAQTHKKELQPLH